MEKGISSGKRKNKSSIYTHKKKWFKEYWNFEYKARIEDENKRNLQQHKDLESDSRKPNKIPRDFFNLYERREEETYRNIRPSAERLNITNEQLLSTLASLETKTTAESNDPTVEPIKDDFLEERQRHTTGT